MKVRVCEECTPKLYWKKTKELKKLAKIVAAHASDAASPAVPGDGVILASHVKCLHAWHCSMCSVMEAPPRSCPGCTHMQPLRSLSVEACCLESIFCACACL